MSKNSVTEIYLFFSTKWNLTKLFKHSKSMLFTAPLASNLVYNCPNFPPFNPIAPLVTQSSIYHACRLYLVDPIFLHQITWANALLLCLIHWTLLSVIDEIIIVIAVEWAACRQLRQLGHWERLMKSCWCHLVSCNYGTMFYDVVYVSSVYLYEQYTGSF